MSGTRYNGDSKPLALPQPSDDDIFGDNIFDNADLEELTTIDLTEATEVLEELKKPEVDNRIKISAFQCVICMDDVSTLTVTHCGRCPCTSGFQHVANPVPKAIYTASNVCTRHSMSILLEGNAPCAAPK